MHLQYTANNLFDLSRNRHETFSRKNKKINGGI